MRNIENRKEVCNLKQAVFHGQEMWIGICLLYTSNAGDILQLGSYAGFQLFAERDTAFKKVWLCIQGEGKYSVEAGDSAIGNIKMCIRDRPPQEVGTTVMNRAFANKDIKINYIAGYLKENLQIEDLQVAAILGNMYAESQFSPLVSEADSKDLYQPEYIKKYNDSIEEDGLGWGSVSYTHLDVYKRQE